MNSLLIFLCVCAVDQWHTVLERARRENFDRDVSIVAMKDTLTPEPDPGYADIKVILSFAIQEAYSGEADAEPPRRAVVCELQLLPRAMFAAKKHLDGHEAYKEVRTAEEIDACYQSLVDPGKDTVFELP